MRIALILLCASLILSGCSQSSGGADAGSSAESSSVETTSAVSTEETTNAEISSADTSESESLTSENVTETVTEVTTAETEVVTEFIPATEAVSIPIPETEPPTGGVEFVGSKYTRDQLNAFDTTKSGYGQGVHVDADNRPAGAVVMQNKYGQYDAVYIAPKSEKVYLTLDLGWENGYTGSIIDTLNEKGVKGVFFVTMDYCRSSPDIVKRIIDEGHVLGNHSVHHYSMPTLTIDQMEEEIMGLHNYIKDNYGYEMKLFRPPMGEFSEQSLALTQSLGYQSMLWSFAYYDYNVNDQPDIASAYSRVTGALHGGAVYLLHAVSATNDAILGDTIDYIRSQGYTIAKYES